MLVFQKILRTYYMVNFIVLTLNNGVTCASEFGIRKLRQNGAVNIIPPILLVLSENSLLFICLCSRQLHVQS